MKESEGLTPHAQKKPLYILKLYVAGNEQNSQLARDNLKQICSEHLNGRCRIEEVDVLTDFIPALRDRVFVTPTLILVEPEPKVMVVGNLSEKEKVLSALRLRFENET